MGDQGCVILPAGQGSVRFTPVDVKSRLPDPATRPWPMGDVVPKDPLPPGIDAAKVKRAVDLAFEPAEALTAAVVVTWRGRLVTSVVGVHGAHLRTELGGHLLA